MRRKMNDLIIQRNAQLQAAENALAANNQAEYAAAMVKVENMNTEISNLQTLIAERDRQFRPATAAEHRDMAEERGNALMNGESITFTANELRRDIRNAVTMANGNIAEPTGAGGVIRDPAGSAVSSIVDQVYVTDMTGMGAFLEPYVVTEMEAKKGKIKTVAGTARAETDPGFRMAKISPYELSTTTFVDRNIGRLSPVSYYEKVHAMAVRALRRGVADLIVNGDGQDSPDFFGIDTAKNTVGENICATVELGALNEETLDTLFLSYGSDVIGQDARLYLPKTALQAIGKLRNDDKQRVFKIKPDVGNPNTGVIEDGGVIIPYAITPNSNKLLYGDPMNFELGLFGDYTVRIDESVKSVERMLAVLGDATVGGNLICHHGFVVADIPA